jgi:hypothetical protein
MQYETSPIFSFSDTTALSSANGELLLARAKPGAPTCGAPSSSPSSASVFFALRPCACPARAMAAASCLGTGLAVSYALSLTPLTCCCAPRACRVSCSLHESSPAACWWRWSWPWSRQRARIATRRRCVRALRRRVRAPRACRACVQFSTLLFRLCVL